MSPLANIRPRVKKFKTRIFIEVHKEYCYKSQIYIDRKYRVPWIQKKIKKRLKLIDSILTFKVLTIQFRRKICRYINHFLYKNEDRLTRNYKINWRKLKKKILQPHQRRIS